MIVTAINESAKQEKELCESSWR